VPSLIFLGLVALPFGFAALLVGRALQGIGMSLVPLAMTVARASVHPDRAAGAVGLLAVTAAAGAAARRHSPGAVAWP
jgi:hypothetical protein